VPLERARPSESFSYPNTVRGVPPDAAKARYRGPWGIISEHCSENASCRCKRLAASLSGSLSRTLFGECLLMPRSHGLEHHHRRRPVAFQRGAGVAAPAHPAAKRYLTPLRGWRRARLNGAPSIPISRSERRSKVASPSGSLYGNFPAQSALASSAVSIEVNSWRSRSTIGGMGLQLDDCGEHAEPTSV